MRVHDIRLKPAADADGSDLRLQVGIVGIARHRHTVHAEPEPVAKLGEGLLRALPARA